MHDLVSFAVLTISFVAPVGAARAVLGLVMGQLARRRSTSALHTKTP